MCSNANMSSLDDDDPVAAVEAPAVNKDELNKELVKQLLSLTKGIM